MRKGKRLVLDEINLKILEIVSKHPEGIYFPRLIDEFSGKETSGLERTRIKNILYGRVRRLEKYGYLLTWKHQGLLWLKLNPLKQEDFKVRIKMKKCYSVPAKNDKHHRKLNDVVKELLNSLGFNGVRFIRDVKVERIDGKRVITGLIGLKDRKKPFIIRIYGFNRPLSESRVRRDISLFDKFPNHLKIVISTSYVERRALRLLKKLGVQSIFTLNYNIYNYGNPGRFKARWNFRRRLYPELPRNPPIIISMKEFIALIKAGKIRAIGKLKAFLYLTLRRISRLARLMDDVMYRLKFQLISKIREGDYRATRKLLFGIDLLRDYLSYGLPPP